MAKMRRKRDLPTKSCLACGRPFSWRKRWARTWTELRFCSIRCRGDARLVKSPDAPERP
ncbi:MAG: DUF2256 domain-containing protein [Alphaproteobacteria bacterium]|nr:DUF2256 domain-containing protein [Alphaproteobacteria bacterium]